MVSRFPPSRGFAFAREIRVAIGMRPLSHSLYSVRSRGILLLNFLRAGPDNKGMRERRRPDQRPDVAAAMRGRDPSSGMDGEVDPRTASLEEATFWRKVYVEILAM